MNNLLDQETLTEITSNQQDETLPECLQAYRPFVMLWSEKRRLENDRELKIEFSDGYQGIIDAAHVHDDITHEYDSNGIYITDSSLSG